MSPTGRARSVGRRAANSTALEAVARLGFFARGLIYLLIGVIAVQIARGHGGKADQADRGGALKQIAAERFGTVLLWVLVIGFAGLALWRLSEAAFGAHTPGGHKPGERLMSLARAVLYGFFFVGTLKLVLGDSASATANGNRQSKDLTAQVMAHPGGRTAVGVVGVVVVIIGVMLVKESWSKDFLKRMSFTGAPAGARAMVTRLGVGGGVARGVVTMLAGVFLTVAAISFKPSQAEGIDGTLRSFAHTPLGPLLLVVVALGLIAFGLFSWCEARWRHV
jgi:hypothetical protein